MRRKRTYVIFATRLVTVIVAGWLLGSCSQTTGPSPNIIQRAEGETPAAPPQSGFLGSDYSLLQPASSGSVAGQQALLAYINLNGNFSQYNKVMIAPVTFWADSNSQLSSDEQQALCNYAYNVFPTDPEQEFCSHE